MNRLFAVVALALVPFCAPAQTPDAATDADAVAATSGAWEISNAEHDQTCALTFKPDAVPGGHRIEFDRDDCAARFPPIRDVAAWTVIGDNNIRFLDPKGKVIYDFTEVENGLYEHLEPGQPLARLQSAAAAAASADVVQTADQLAGAWNVVRGGGDAICVLTLLKTPVSATDMALTVSAACDAAVKGFGPVSWQIDGDTLILKSARGRLWRFQNDNGMWQRIPQDPDPLALARK